MPQNKPKSTSTHNTRTRKSASEPLQQISKSSAQIVKDAAALLDEEVAAGIVAARQVQQRFQKDRHINPGDFKKALEKFQGDAHEVITLLDGQIDEMRSDKNAGLAKSLLRKTHDMLDLAVDLVNTGAEVADQLAQSNLKQNASSRGKRSR